MSGRWWSAKGVGGGGRLPAIHPRAVCRWPVGTVRVCPDGGSKVSGACAGVWVCKTPAVHHACLMSIYTAVWGNADHAAIVGLFVHATVRRAGSLTPTNVPL